jgi:hypothetical protein
MTTTMHRAPKHAPCVCVCDLATQVARALPSRISRCWTERRSHTGRNRGTNASSAPYLKTNKRTPYVGVGAQRRVVCLRRADGRTDGWTADGGRKTAHHEPSTHTHCVRHSTHHTPSVAHPRQQTGRRPRISTLKNFEQRKCHSLKIKKKVTRAKFTLYCNSRYSITVVINIILL